MKEWDAMLKLNAIGGIMEYLSPIFAIKFPDLNIKFNRLTLNSLSLLKLNNVSSIGLLWCLWYEVCKGSSGWRYKKRNCNVYNALTISES